MTKTLKALIVDGRVHELAPFLEGTYHPDLDVRDIAGLKGIAVGWTVDEAGKYSAPVDLPLTAERLQDLKGHLKRQVDTQAEALRQTLISPGAGQAMEYQEAYTQAQAALMVAGEVDASDYPMLAATIGVDIDPKTRKPAADVLGVARSVKAAYEAYMQDSTAIRGARLLAKAEIEAAGDADHARAVFAAVAWPSLN